MMTDDRELTREELEPHAGDPVVRHMLDNNIPLTREKYLTYAYGADLPAPEEWNHEHEAGLPEPFRDPSSVLPEG